MIASRLQSPVTAQVTLRKRLLERLDEALHENKSVWISSPPGSGKTTIVASYIAEYDYQVLWYQLDNTDAELATFFQYLTQAAAPLIADNVALLPALTPEYRPNLKQFARRYFDLLFSNLSSPTIIVFDNYQELDTDSELHDLLAWLIEKLPAHIRIAFISREVPTKEFARLRLNQHLELIDWKEVRFTDGESEAFLKHKGISDPDLINAIRKNANGWAAALILMSQSKKPIDTTANTSTDHQLIFDYFAIEIMKQATEEEQRILALSALSPFFSITMLASTSKKNETDVAELINGLYQKQYFVEKRAGEKEYFQYHPLFRQFLLKEYEKRFPKAEANALILQTAAMLQQDGQLEEAVKLMISVQAWQELAAVCLQQAQGLLMTGRFTTLMEWISAIPESIQKEIPWLIYWNASALMPVNPRQAKELFAKAYHEFKSKEDITGTYLSWAGIVRTFAYIWDMREAGYWLDQFDDLQQLYPDCLAIDIEFQVLTALLPCIIWLDYETERYPNLIPRFRQLIEIVDEPNMLAALSATLLWYYNATTSNCQDSADLASRVHEQIINSQIPPMNKVLWLIQYFLHLAFLGDRETAEQELLNTLEYVEAHELIAYRSPIMAVGYSAYMFSEQTEKASKLLDSMEKSLSPHSLLDTACYYFLKSWFSFYRGTPQDTDFFAKKATEYAAESGMDYIQGLSGQLLFLNCLRQGNETAAKTCLDKFKQYAEKTAKPSMLYLSLFIQAKMAVYQGSKETSQRALKKLFSYAKEHHLLNIYGLVIKEMRPLYELALAYHIETEQVCRLIRANHVKPSEFGKTLENWPWRIRINVLGKFGIEVNGEIIKISGKQYRVIELLKLLVIKHQLPLNKDEVITAIWPGAEPDKAEQSLKTSIHRLRKLIGADAVISAEGLLSMDKDIVWVDAWAIEGMLDTSNNAIEELSNTCRRISSLYKGKVLEEDENYWLLDYRDKLHRKCSNILLSELEP